MNLIDNGVKEILGVEQIITESKCCFKVTFKDWYGVVRTKEVSDLERFKHSSWME